MPSLVFYPSERITCFKFVKTSGKQFKSIASNNYNVSMKMTVRISAFAFLVCVLLFGVLTSNSWSQTKSLKPLRGKPITLFDGTSMDGWVKRDGSQPKNWVIDEGTLFRKSGGGDLYHQDWYRDFELSFEWKLQEAGNSGVKYRVRQYGKQMLGCEYQLQDDKDRPFNRHATGALYAVYEPGKNKETKPVGSWNTSKIVVCGNKIEHWLNGEKVVDADVASLDWIKRVKGSKFRQKTTDGRAFGEHREGQIFLQDHGNPVWYRNIVVVPLDCELLTYQ